MKLLNKTSAQPKLGGKLQSIGERLTDRPNAATRLAIDLWRNRWNLLMILPCLIYLAVFAYKPMYGIIIAFKKFGPGRTYAECDWVGLKYFEQFLLDPYFFKTLKNTLSLSILSLVIGFPIPILFALLINEIRSKKFKKTIQTISYMPYFISTVVICGLVTQFCLSNGLINNIIVWFGGERSNLLSRPELFYAIILISDQWQSMGWSSIIYLSTLASIDQEQYEAARIDGASRIQQMFYITLPGLAPVVSIQLILRVGGLLSVGMEKILLLYNPSTYEVSDMISTYTYRKGLISGEFSYSTAVSVFNTAINLILLNVANKVATKVGQASFF
jgi:putative aldouronate transport system permease protein